MEPVAVVGMGCRFPGGADGPGRFWELLREGHQAVRPLPAGRRRLSPSVDATRIGGFIEGIDLFDASFFGIAAAEARFTDPQQRLLLEVAWEALEHAGIDPSGLRGSRTAVFVGAFTNDYELLQSKAATDLGSSPYFGSGTSAAMLAGRLSYRLGLMGPSMVINTACSASLVSVHLACQSLNAGECDLALVAGVNLILSNELTASFEEAGMLSPDGRCKPFDASADGYVRSEGCGVLVLRRSSDVMAGRDRVVAFIEGTAVNQDGPSPGLTAPSQFAQEQVIRQALSCARLEPASVQYIEAHGTGTPLGDVIEIQALAQVFAGDARERPLVVGSVKGNIGHGEAAAGMAGLMKALLSIEQGSMVPTLNHQTRNPAIGLDEFPLEIATELRPWEPGPDGRRRAGVSSFGFSGTNAHVIVCSAPPPRKPSGCPRAFHALSVSAASEAALNELARTYATVLRAGGLDGLGDICHGANAGRQHFRYRLAVIGDEPESMAGVLERLSGGDADAAGGHVGIGGGAAAEVAFLFSGQGSQYPGMGRELYRTSLTFKRMLDRCDELASEELQHSLIALILGEAAEGPDPTDTRYTQPILFSWQVALAEVWKHWGVRPAAVLGHSVGEYAAAVVCGAISLEDGMRMVLLRGRLMQDLPRGAMTAVQAGASTVRPLIADLADRLCIAAINTPDSCVLSGHAEAMQAMHERLFNEDIGFTELAVSHAFHSMMLDSMLPELEAAAKTLAIGEPSVPLVSSLHGQVVSGDDLRQAGYWSRHARQPVQFEQGVATLGAMGYSVFLEIGPASTLLNLARHCRPSVDSVWLPSLSSSQPDWKTLLNSAGRLYAMGLPVRWDHVDEGFEFEPVRLPTYPFQRKSYWFTDSTKRNQLSGEGMSRGSVGSVTVHAKSSQPTENGTLRDYYRSLMGRVRQSKRSEHQLIRFAPLTTPLEGFSWLPTFVGLPLDDAHRAVVERAHQRMRELMFRHVDFSTVTRVLDIGCGYSTDLIELAQEHPHLRLDGCNISADQLAHGREAIADAGLGHRISLHEINSAKKEFPGLYDLVFAYQVIHHITDKAGVFRNIRDHLRGGGYLVAAEIISNLDEPIEHADSTAYFATKREWASLLAENRLRAVECIDISREIATYLYDPHFEEHLAQWAADADDLTVKHLRGPDGLAQLLRRELASYCLLTIQHDPYAQPARLLEVNQQCFAQPLSYEQACREGGERRAESVPVRSPVRTAASWATQAVVPPARPRLQAREAELPAPVESGTDPLRAMLSQILECSPHDLDPHCPLVQMGLNSISAMELSRRIKTQLDVRIAPKLLLGGCTLVQLREQCHLGPEPSGTAFRPANTSRGPEQAMQGAAAGISALVDGLATLGESELDRLIAALERQRGLAPAC